MKYFLVVLVLLAVLAGTAFAGGSQESGELSGVLPTLELLQNKPEIDPQLKAYAKVWGETNGVDVVIKTVGGRIFSSKFSWRSYPWIYLAVYF